MAEMWRYDGGGVARKIREAWRYDAGGTARKAREIWRYGADGVARKVFSGSFTLTASTASVFGSGFTSTRGASVPVTTTPVTVTVQGGAGVFTIAWSTLSGSSATAMSPNLATTQFRRNAAAPTTVGKANTLSGVQRCTVTEINTGEVKTIDVTVVTEHWYDF
jgi:hypothetical protein